MDQQPSPREFASAHILGQYQQAGLRFDGIYQMLLTHLRENRQADPQPREYAQLLADISRLGFADYRDPVTPWPNFVIDGSVLLSFARMDNRTVGAALIDAVADSSCQVIASPLAYLHIADQLAAARGADQRLHRVLRHRPADETPASPAVVDVPPLTFRQVDVITQLNTGERLDTMHTALLALHYRCVIGTLEPEVYHRIGYGRVLNLAG
ncbi:hypothetical protein ACIBSW_33480 [Actinoplanes sp. NPDC049668]|uniref:hypothetical protein n=1 Tax=unclassified Actinoplanes TaxID=2626549 RepID=UPI0033BF3653